MDKESYLAELREALGGLPEADVEESLAYYTELIEDRMEDGLESALEAVKDKEYDRAERLLTELLKLDQEESNGI